MYFDTKNRRRSAKKLIGLTGMKDLDEAEDLEEAKSLFNLSKTLRVKKMALE